MSLVQLFIKISLSVLLLVCILNMPYGYYQFVRFAGMIGFALLAYFSFEQNKKVAVIIYVALALLFQPFIKLALGRILWNAVDVLVAIGLIVSLFLEVKEKNK